MRYLFPFLLLICINGVAQTKKIAFKSHSGSTENFSIALENNLFDMENSNFGEHPDMKRFHEQMKSFESNLDSVILIKDSVAVLVSKRISGGIAKRDTLRSQALFTKKTPMDSIKRNIKNVTWFTNPVDSIKFIGFDAKKQKKKRNELIPGVITNDSNYRPFDGQVLLIISLIVFLSLVAGLFTWKYRPLQLG